MTETSDVTGDSPQALSFEVLVAGMLFATSAGLTGLASLDPQSPPSVLLMLGWPLFAVVGGILLDRTPALTLGRTFAALSLAPVAIAVWSLTRWGDVESRELASATADLAPALGCAVAIALPWAFRMPPCARVEQVMWIAAGLVAGAGSLLVLAARVAGWPGPVLATGWLFAGAGTLGAWILSARSVSGGERASRRRMGWLLVALAAGCAVVATTWLVWPGNAGFYATCGTLMIGSIGVAHLWAATGFRPLDEHLLDVGLVLGVAATSAVVTGLVTAGSTIAHRPTNATTVVFTALLTTAMTVPAAFWVRRNLLSRRYGSGLIPPEDVAAITADLHARTEPRDLLDKAASMVAAASGSTEVRIVLGDDDPSAPDQWVVHPLEVGGDRVGSLLIESTDPEGLELRQQRVVAQLVPTVALVARAVGLAVEAEHARRDVARERDAERKRVLGDLHDGLGPALAGMSMRVQAALRTTTSSDDAALLRQLAEELSESRTDLRRIVAGITPSTLDDGNLDAALRRLVDSFRGATESPEVGLTVDLGGEVAPEIQVAVYRSVAEGITNGLRHASAMTIDVDVRRRDGRVIVDVSDNGVGGAVVPGVGLSSLSRRAESLGGHLTICSRDPGTTLHLELPASGTSTRNAGPA